MEVLHMLMACKSIQKHFGVDPVLKDITFQMNEKDKAAVVGVNGAGKTTLFKILTGELTADRGELFRSKDSTLGYLAQNMNILGENTIFAEMLTVFTSLQNLESEIRTMELAMGTATGSTLEKMMAQYAALQHSFEEQNGYGYQSQIRGVLKGLGFSEEEFDQPIYQLSGGQKTRVALGKLLLIQPSILLLDEPTNHLDIAAIEWLENFLRSYPGAILIISHDRFFLDQIVKKVIDIENGKSAVYEGNYSFFAKHKEINREIQLKQFLDQQKGIKRQEQVIEKLRSFNREKSIKRAESREKLLEKVERLEKPEEISAKMKLHLTPRLTSGQDVLHVENMAKSFDGCPLFEQVSFDIKKQEKIALLGPNGIGKTTLFRILMGQIPSDCGITRFGSNVKIGYYDQEQQNLSLEKTIIEEISDTYPTLTQTVIRNTLAAFLFTGDDVFKPISALSGGEKGRVSLAKLMLSGSNLLFLDEPTNHLDMYSKEILEDALNQYEGTILYISHDRYFINRTATKILELSPTGMTQYIGDYSYYVEKKQQSSLIVEATQSKADEDTGSTKEEWLRKKEDQAKEKRRQTQIERIEADIGKTEKKIKDIDDLLCLQEVYSDPLKAQEAYDEKSRLETDLEELYTNWDQLQQE